MATDTTSGRRGFGACVATEGQFGHRVVMERQLAPCEPRSSLCNESGQCGHAREQANTMRYSHAGSNHLLKSPMRSRAISRILPCATLMLALATIPI
jgi:hypothetical protein